MFSQKFYLDWIKRNLTQNSLKLNANFGKHFRSTGTVPSKYQFPPVIICKYLFENIACAKIFCYANLTREE